MLAELFSLGHLSLALCLDLLTIGLIRNLLEIDFNIVNGSIDTGGQTTGSNLRQKKNVEGDVESKGGREKRIFYLNIPLILSSAITVRFGYIDVLREVILEDQTYSLNVL